MRIFNPSGGNALAEGLTYKLFSARECPPEVFRFRYEVYVEELHRRQSFADETTRTIRDPLDESAVHSVVFKGDEVVGSVRINMLRDGGLWRYLDLYDICKLPPDEQATACICTRNMVRADYRKTGVSVRMLKQIYEFGMRAGMTTCFMDVNEPLEKLFVKFGYKFQFRREHPEYGMVAVYRLDVLDLDYLREVRSPFAPICAEFLGRSDRARAEPALAAE